MQNNTFKEEIKKISSSSSKIELQKNIKSYCTPNLDFSQIRFLNKTLKKAELQRPLLRIAFLFTGTSIQLEQCLETFLLSEGSPCEFYTPAFSTSMQEVLDPLSELYSFNPDICFIGTHYRDIEIDLSQAMLTESIFSSLIDKNISFLKSVWSNLKKNTQAFIVQNDIDIPHLLSLGTWERQAQYSATRLFMALNDFLYQQKEITIHSIESFSSNIGKNQWHNPDYYHRAKMFPHPDFLIPYAHNLSKTILSLKGLSKKCLVLDLDGTLWGGIIGDDGSKGIIIEQGNPLGEAFLDFQRYIKSLKNKGVILAVCSKNSESIAKSAFTERDMILSLDDFSCFVANWEDKASNIKLIAKQLNINTDSLVFIDDTTLECNWVKSQLPEVSVIQADRNNPSLSIKLIAESMFFDRYSLADEDKNRTTYYKENNLRTESKNTLGMDQFLKELNMIMTISHANPINMDRIVQLTNKSNQFNLCTKRTSTEETLSRTNSKDWLILQASLKDKFGDNGIIAVATLSLDHKNKIAHLENMLMSCRVLKRRVEFAFFDYFIKELYSQGFLTLFAEYLPSPKNSLVKNLLKDMNFSKTNHQWELTLSNWKTLKHAIEIITHD